MYRVMKKMTLNEAIEYIENHDDPFIEFGFRADTFIPKDKFNNSWYHGDDMPEYELGGVSVVKVMAADEMYIKQVYRQLQEYYIGNRDDTVFLLEGECVNADEVTHDPGEALMVEHRIVAILAEGN